MAHRQRNQQQMQRKRQRVPTPTKAKKKEGEAAKKRARTEEPPKAEEAASSAPSEELLPLLATELWLTYILPRVKPERDEQLITATVELCDELWDCREKLTDYGRRQMQPVWNTIHTKLCGERNPRICCPKCAAKCRWCGRHWQRKTIKSVYCNWMESYLCPVCWEKLPRKIAKEKAYQAKAAAEKEAAEALAKENTALESQD